MSHRRKAESRSGRSAGVWRGSPGFLLKCDSQLDLDTGTERSPVTLSSASAADHLGPSLLRAVVARFDAVESRMSLKQ